MNYLDQFTAYAPELGRAIRKMDSEFVRELESEEPSLAAFTVCEAFSVFWWAWHGGQSSRLYSLGSRFNHEFDFKPAPNLSEESLAETARDLMDHIQSEFHAEQS